MIKSILDSNHLETGKRCRHAYLTLFACHTYHRVVRSLAADMLYCNELCKNFNDFHKIRISLTFPVQKREILADNNSFYASTARRISPDLNGPVNYHSQSVASTLIIITLPQTARKRNRISQTQILNSLKLYIK